MDPNMLTARLAYVPLDICALIEGTKDTDIQQRIKNAETLLLFLLHTEKEDWPADFIQGLQETNQKPLAKRLQEDYKKVVREEVIRKEQFLKKNENELGEFVSEVRMTFFHASTLKYRWKLSTNKIWLE